MAAPDGLWAVETRQLTPGESRLLLGFLEQLGHDSRRVGELKVTSTPFGLRAEVTHRVDPKAGRLVVPGRLPVASVPQLVIAAG